MNLKEIACLKIRVLSLFTHAHTFQIYLNIVEHKKRNLNNFFMDFHHIADKLQKSNIKERWMDG